MDLTLTLGLNTIIGARGTGKTSLIEVIRFALGVRGFSAETEKRSESHARAILGSGNVTITINTRDGSETIISRSTLESAPRSSIEFERPLILSQAEIETLALSPAGRLRLVDGFIDDEFKDRRREEICISEIRSLTSAIRDRREEIENLENEISHLPDITRQLAELRPKEASISRASADAASKNSQLEEITKQTSLLGIQSKKFSRYLELNSRRQSLANQVIQQWSVDDKILNDTPGMQSLGSLSAAAYDQILLALNLLQQAASTAHLEQQKIEVHRLNVENSARKLRSEIESLQIGAGQVARQIQQIRERIAHIKSLQPYLDEKRKDLGDLCVRRNKALDILDALRDERFKQRAKVATFLNEKLRPRIKTEIERAGQIEAYAAAIATTLRGSGLRYNELSQNIAKSVSPRELLDWAENDDVEALADAALLQRERAARALAAFRESNLGELGTLLVEDDAQFCLLDGADHKPITALSMGQRCTVVLPIVLERRDTVLVIDQPEDHIDNAFIAETLIVALRDRANEGQVILTTHNANIPVLGNASRVVQMGSDGRRGYAIISAALDEGRAVEAITSVMEGGREAFKKRAQFYAGPQRK